MSAAENAHVPGITASALSQHLRQMKNAGILDSEKQGMNVIYRIKHLFPLYKFHPVHRSEPAVALLDFYCIIFAVHQNFHRFSPGNKLQCSSVFSTVICNLSRKFIYCLRSFLEVHKENSRFYRLFISFFDIIHTLL